MLRQFQVQANRKPHMDMDNSTDKLLILEFLLIDQHVLNTINMKISHKLTITIIL